MAIGTLVKNHLCPSCGGVLSVDVERQMYECPFCGVTFDYDYFREEAVLDIAKRAVMVGEFDSATRAYKFMLDKEPDNFWALRGMALMTLKTTNVNSLSKMDIYTEFNTEKTIEAVDVAIEESKPEHREYFELMKDVIHTGNEYAKEEKLLSDEKELKGKADYRLKITKGLNGDSDSGRKTSRSVIKRIFSLASLALVFAVLWWIFVGALFVNENPYTPERYYSKTRKSYSTTTTREMDAKEMKRIEMYEKWEKEHANDDIKLRVMFAMPLILFAFCVFGLINSRNVSKEAIADIEDEIRFHNDSINMYEKKLKELRGRIIEDMKKMKSLEPVTT